MQLYISPHYTLTFGESLLHLAVFIGVFRFSCTLIVAIYYARKMKASFLQEHYAIKKFIIIYILLSISVAKFPLQGLSSSSKALMFWIL